MQQGRLLRDKTWVINVLTIVSVDYGEFLLYSYSFESFDCFGKFTYAFEIYGKK